VENPNAKKKRKKKPLNVQSRRGKRRATVVLDRIVDTMFSDSVPRHGSINTARMPENARRTEVRQAAKRAIRNWTAKGKPWSKLVTRFGWGILLLVPEDLSDEK
jgi:hypothetical protein